MGTCPRPPSKAVKAVMRATAGSTPGRQIRSTRHGRGYRFGKDHPTEAGHARAHGHRVPTSVFINGCSGHACPQHGPVPKADSRYWQPKPERNVRRDQRVVRRATRGGLTVVGVWEHRLSNEAGLQIVAALARR
jgi:DNA mismatch endonuclease, patch repair protein